MKTLNIVGPWRKTRINLLAPIKFISMIEVPRQMDLIIMNVKYREIQILLVVCRRENNHINDRSVHA